MSYAFSTSKKTAVVLFSSLKPFFCAACHLTESIHDGFMFPESMLLRTENIIILQKPRRPLVYHYFKQFADAAD